MVLGLTVVGLGVGVRQAAAVGANAGAVNVVTPAGAPLTSGGSATPFRFKLPNGAACAGDSAHAGYRIQSYLVPQAVDPATLTFDSNGPVPVAGQFRQAMFGTDSNSYVDQLTAVAVPAGGPGPIIQPLPSFDFAVFSPAGFPFTPGVYNVGIACTIGPPSATQQEKYWNTVMTVSADPTDTGPAKIRWTVPAPTTQSVVSTQQYTLTGSDGSTWQQVDATNLQLTVNPATSVVAQVLANADLWTWDSGFNQDIAVFVDGALAGWKESGGFAGTFSPNAATVVLSVPLNAGAHTIDLRWKTNKPDPGGKISAGAGPISGAFSPTRLTTTLLPTGSAPTAVSTQQYTLTGSDGSTWQQIDATNLQLTVNPATSVVAQVLANADLWTWDAGFNQDIAVFVDGALAGWKESGGFAGTFSPNAATVVLSVPLNAGAHTIDLRWKTNKPDPGGKISAGAGPISGAFSPATLTAVFRST